MPSCKDTAILREEEENRYSGLLHDVLWDHESDGKVAAAPREVRHGDIRIFDFVFFESEKLCFDPNTRKKSVFLLRRQLAS